MEPRPGTSHHGRPPRHQKAERIPATSDVETLGKLGIGVGGARSPKAARQGPQVLAVP